MLSLLLLGRALAGTPAFYHPDDIAAASAKFGAAADAVGPPFEAAEAVVTKLDGQLNRLETGVWLLGADAPEPLRTYADQARRSFTAQYLQLNAVAGKLQDDFGRVFGDALTRALPAATAGKDAKECTATGVAALVHHQTCAGENLNPALAKAIDADPQLDRDLAALDATKWPTITLEKAVQPVLAITGTARSADLATVANALIGAHLKARRDDLDANLEPLQEQIEEKDAAAITKGGELRKAFQAKVGEDGVALRAAVVEALARAEKKGGPTQVGWCANPVELGGCGVPDVTESLLPLLQADKKLAKALESFQ
jgi:hypothetical protein